MLTVNAWSNRTIIIMLSLRRNRFLCPRRANLGFGDTEIAGRGDQPAWRPDSVRLWWCGVSGWIGIRHPHLLPPVCPILTVLRVSFSSVSLWILPGFTLHAPELRGPVAGCGLGRPEGMGGMPDFRVPWWPGWWARGWGMPEVWVPSGPSGLGLLTP